MDFLDPNQVKVLCDQLGYALYFSRSPIPYNRNYSSLWENKQANLPLKHLGMYGYNADFLGRFLTFPEGKLEKVEKLEQLRALENGEKIATNQMAGLISMMKNAMEMAAAKRLTSDAQTQRIQDRAKSAANLKGSE